MNTFKKLLESVDRRSENRHVDVDLRRGGEIWHMGNDYEQEIQDEHIVLFDEMEVVHAYHED